MGSKRNMKAELLALEITERLGVEPDDDTWDWLCVRLGAEELAGPDTKKPVKPGSKKKGGKQRKLRPQRVKLLRWHDCVHR